MPYHLTNHPRKYDLSYKDIGLSLITGLSGAPYASRHWQLSNYAKAKHCLGHRLIACIESIPFAGALAAILERIIVFIQEKLLKNGVLTKHKAGTSPSCHAIANTLVVSHLASTSSPLPETSIVGLLDHGQYSLQDKQSRDVYDRKEPQELQVLLKRSVENIANIYEASRKLMKPSRSKQYSLLVSEVEEEVAKIKILGKVLADKDQLVESKQIEGQEKVLKQMYKDMPLGESVLLRWDIEMMKGMSRRPAEKIYTTSYGTFENPNVSHLELSRWFSSYITEGAFFGFCCMFREHELGEEKDFNRMFTCINLTKSDEQRKIERKLYNGRPSFWGNIQSSLFSIGRNLLSKNQPSDEAEEKKETQALSLPFTEASEAGFISLPNKPVSNYQIKQQKVLAKLAQDLPAMMEVWNVDSFQILTSEHMLAEGYEYEAAYSGDRILLFHKRVENQEAASSAMDPLSTQGKSD
ncbi:MULTISPECIES: hypothetical protein [unclassified Neochlamydia]|uniref:hypothetical protein n=1 Tax=unclassified Neochlamydia TaxID=2643326 RepID=UPI00140B940C|nr:MULTISPECIES: hypothetical protein [unclassified Neochlamydia]MBS4170239.1 Uncharacterized protein [Neochlamydia sp. AcF95]NGY95551.1 hypothetical protein [Neochlamydia sp. AcF84]